MLKYLKMQNHSATEIYNQIKILITKLSEEVQVATYINMLLYDIKLSGITKPAETTASYGALNEVQQRAIVYRLDNRWQHLTVMYMNRTCLLGKLTNSKNKLIHAIKCPYLSVALKIVNEVLTAH